MNEKETGAKQKGTDARKKKEKKQWVAPKLNSFSSFTNKVIGFSACTGGVGDGACGD